MKKEQFQSLTSWEKTMALHEQYEIVKMLKLGRPTVRRWYMGSEPRIETKMILSKIFLSLSEEEISLRKAVKGIEE